MLRSGRTDFTGISGR